MSDQTPSPFAPFQMPSPPIAPEKPKDKPETAAQKKAREKREAKAAKKEDAQIEKRNQQNAGTVAPTRQRRKPAFKAHSPKFDLQTTLAAAQLLKEDDFPLFEKLVVMLDEAGKPTRDRVLGALSKVFG